jgi:ribosomal protein L7/L12
VVAYLDALSASEMGALIEALERRLGVHVAGVSEQAVAYAVVLHDVGSRKIAVIHELIYRLPCTLSEAVPLVTALPATLQGGLTLAAAQALASQVREVGPGVEVEVCPVTARGGGGEAAPR